MATNSLEIFKQLFLKNPKDIKDIFTNVTSLVEVKDKAIADFLSVEYPELIWLIRVLQEEYEKQFSPAVHTQQHVVERIARSITLNVDETGTLDYGQTIHNNIVINSLKHHRVTAQPATLQGVQDQDDIISLDDNSSEMDLIYQKTTSFTDIAQQLASSSAQHLSTQDNTNSTSTQTSSAHTSHVAS